MPRLLTWERFVYIVLGAWALYDRYQTTGDMKELLIAIPVMIVGFELVLFVHRWKTKLSDDLASIHHLSARKKRNDA